MSGNNLWWGYLYINGSLRVKRYFNPLDLEEARRSPFTSIVVAPFKAMDRQHALKMLAAKLKFSRGEVA